MSAVREVFVTGGTGYIGQRVIAELLGRGHRVRALSRAASAQRIPEGASPVIADALEAGSFADSVRPADTFIHLIGTPHPSPAKAAQFVSVDLASARAAVSAARQAGVAHFIYVSVAQPAPVMRAYQEARAAGERAIREAGLTATILRPWYVLGPGHWWPILLIPGYVVGELLPATRATAQRMGLVTLKQMVSGLLQAAENPPAAGAVRIMEVPEIRGR